MKQHFTNDFVWTVLDDWMTYKKVYSEEPFKTFYMCTLSSTIEEESSWGKCPGPTFQQGPRKILLMLETFKEDACWILGHEKLQRQDFSLLLHLIPLCYVILQEQTTLMI